MLHVFFFQFCHLLNMSCSRVKEYQAFPELTMFMCRRTWNEAMKGLHNLCMKKIMHKIFRMCYYTGPLSSQLCTLFQSKCKYAQPLPATSVVHILRRFPPWYIYIYNATCLCKCNFKMAKINLSSYVLIIIVH